MLGYAAQLKCPQAQKGVGCEEAVETLLQFSITELQNAFLSNNLINSQTESRKLPKAPVNWDNHMFYHMDPALLSLGQYVSPRLL